MAAGMMPAAMGPETSSDQLSPGKMNRWRISSARSESADSIKEKRTVPCYDSCSFA